MIITKMSGKYQITVPVPIREVLGLSVGDRLYCMNDQGLILVSLENPRSHEQSIPITIRDRFQLTLPVKKLRVRSFFPDPAVLIERNDKNVFSVRSLPPIDQTVIRDPRTTERGPRTEKTEEFKPPLAREYPETIEKRHAKLGG